jgi:hypothetical protein
VKTELKIHKEIARFNSGGFKKVPTLKKILVFFQTGIWRSEEQILIPASPDSPLWDKADFSIAFITHPKSIKL